MQACFNVGRKLIKVKEKEIQRMKNSTWNMYTNNELSNWDQSNDKVFRYHIWRTYQISQELLPDKYMGCYYCDMLANLLERPIIVLVP